MPKHTEKQMVHDRRGTERVVTLEITAPQFMLDCMEEGKFDPRLVAQEAFDTPGMGFRIDVRVIVKDRDGKARRR